MACHPVSHQPHVCYPVLTLARHQTGGHNRQPVDGTPRTVPAMWSHGPVIGCRMRGPHWLSWRRAGHRCGSSASEETRQGQKCLLQWQVPHLQMRCNISHFRPFALHLHIKLQVAVPAGHAPSAGFVNLTSLRLRGKGCAPSGYNIAWHVEWGYDMSYRLRSLHHLTTPASGGTRYACRALVQHFLHGASRKSTRLEHTGLALLTRASCHAMMSATGILATAPAACERSKP